MNLLPTSSVIWLVPRFELRSLVLVQWTVAILAISVSATAESPTLSGRWQASSMRSAWNIGDWGKACGPRPTGGGAAAGTATITQRGSELTIQGPSRSFSTSQCWEQFPGMSIVSHSGGTRGWRTVCRSAAGDPRQATITTNITATDTHINFDEVGQYQFVVKKQNCTASVRRSRTFRLIQRAGEPSEAEKKKALEAERSQSEQPKEQPTETQPEAPRTPAPKPRACSSPGPPARLEVRPAEKLIREGETFSFRATVLDAEGCTLTVVPQWRLVTSNPAAQLIAPGAVRVAENAPEGPIELNASVGGKSVTVRLQVVSSRKYEQLLRTEAFDARGESRGAAVAIIASGGIGAGKAVAERGGRRLKIILLLALASAAVALGLVGIALARRSQRPASKVESAPEPTPAGAPGREVRMVCPTCGQDYPSDRSFCPNDGNRLVPPASEAAQEQGGICPTCGQGYDPGVERCPEHGEQLVPPAVYQASRPAETRPTRKICPVCGTQYPGDAGFCGRDGAQLVPVN